MYRAGADYVLSLSTVTGRMVASAVLEDEEVIALDTQVEVVRTRAAGLVGRTLGEARVRSKTGAAVVAVERGGALLADVGPEFRVEDGDDLIIAGTDEGINRFTELLGCAGPFGPDSPSVDPDGRTAGVRSRAHGPVVMLAIDGRTGGGQLLRTALSLSAVTNTPFGLEDVRAGRPNPGLAPQHLAAIRLLSGICDAEVTGASVDSTAVTFRPRTIRAGSRRLDVGTAGSIALLFDAVLPLAMRIDTSFEVTAIGGTDVKWAPTMGYFDRVKLPLLRRFGLDVDVALEKTGFYPAGGGEATLRVQPSTCEPITLGARGELERVEVFSMASSELAERDVAERQAGRAEALLDARNLPAAESNVDYVDTFSIGTSLLLRGVYANSLAGFDALGERGKPAEDVAETAVDRFLSFHDGTGAVDEYLGDQLLVFIGLAGGTVRVPRVTDHVRSNVELINRFGFDLRLEPRADGTASIEST